MSAAAILLACKLFELFANDDAWVVYPKVLNIDTGYIV